MRLGQWSQSWFDDVTVGPRVQFPFRIWATNADVVAFSTHTRMPIAVMILRLWIERRDALIAPDPEEATCEGPLICSAKLMLLFFPSNYHPGRKYCKIIPRSMLFSNNLCYPYKNNSTRWFRAMLLPLACPFCKKTSQGNCFVEWFFCNYYKLVVPKKFFVKIFFL